MKLNAIIVTISIVFSSVKAQYRADSFAIPRNCTEIYNITTPKYVPYEETYRTTNWLGLTKYKTRTNYRLENHVSYQKRDICCPGYTNYGNLCTPLCIGRPCGPNGVCVQPEICKCNDGYKIDPTFNECMPVCLNECVNGYCASPGVCICNSGYRMMSDDFTCVPVCSFCSNLEYCVEPAICRCIAGYTRIPNERLDRSIVTECQPVCVRECINADCVEPNFCKCHDGYDNQDHDVFTCEPTCPHGCYFGVCTAPNICTCIEGHQLKANISHICEPVCVDECSNGKCTAPNICECYDGYVPVSEKLKHVCVPYCSSQCTHGKCAKPEVCSCNTGYMEANNRTACEPVCTEVCVMGNCTAPDTCTCFEGYKLAEGSNSTCEPICENPCINGRCTASNECTCDDGYEKRNSTDNDSKCIVICECENGYCNETSSVCETCANGYELTIIDNTTICFPHCEGGCENGHCFKPQKCECNEYYLADNDTQENPVCIHACGGKCLHGTCMVENGTCNCLYGWSGRYCDGPSTCGVVVSENDVILRQLNHSVSYDEFDNAMSFEEPWTGPICHNQCLLEINNATKCSNLTIDKELSTKFVCFVNISSPCNVYRVVQAETYKAEVNVTVIVVSIMASLLLVASAVSVILFIRKRNHEKALELMNTNQENQKPEEDRLIENENDGISL